MDIGLLVAQAKISQPKPAPTVKADASPSSSFDRMFNEAMQSSTEVVTDAPTNEQPMTTEEVVAAITEVIEEPTVEGVFEALGIELDESGSFAKIDGQLIPVEALMNLEDLTAALGMTPEQLQAIVSQLLGEETVPEDVWQLLEQSPLLLAQVTAVFQGENVDVSPKDAAKVVEFLKLAQVVGFKTDTVYQQEFQLMETKNQLQALVTQLAVSAKLAEQTASVKQAVKTIELPQVTATQTITTQQTDVVVNGLTQSTQTKTIAITLPSGPPATQSEALVKEIEAALSRSQLSSSQGQMKLLLKLYPENLGQIRVELFQKDGVMQARLLATVGQTKELLEANLNQLKSALAGQNIQFDRLDVAQSIQSTEQSTRDQNFLNNFFRQQQQEQEEQQQEADDEQSFEEFLQQQIHSEEVE